MENCSISCDEIRQCLAHAPGSLCIVGYGNRERRDDGVGPWVVDELQERPAMAGKVRLLARPQLEPDLLEDLSQAELVILVDASVECHEGGIRWTRIDPGKWRQPFLTHSLEPAFLLNLMEAVHQRSPATWLVSIQGEDFGHGEGLSLPTQERARKVIADLVKMIAEEGRT